MRAHDHYILHVSLGPYVRMLSLHFPPDHDDQDQHHKFYDDRWDRAFDAESHVVEETVRRCRGIQAENGVREHVSAVGKARQDTLREVPAGMHPHGHPHAVKVVDQRAVLNSADHNVYDRDRRCPVIGNVNQAEEYAVDQRRRKILPSVGPEDPVINESAAHDLLSSGLNEHRKKKKQKCPNTESVKIQMNVTVHDRKQDQHPVH